MRCRSYDSFCHWIIAHCGTPGMCTNPTFAATDLLWIACEKADGSMWHLRRLILQPIGVRPSEVLLTWSCNYVRAQLGSPYHERNLGEQGHSCCSFLDCQLALHVRRFKESEKTRAADQAELDAAAAEIAEFERRDVKFKEDRRHCKAKLKKAEEKLAKDAARLQARPPIRCTQSDPAQMA